jgi:signal transduction histidine kinase
MGWINIIFLGGGLIIGWQLSKWLDRLPASAAAVPEIAHETREHSVSQTSTSPAAEQLQKQLQQMQLAYQMAVEMGRFKATFLARTSHELRSPLSSAIGLHQLILSDLCDSPAEEREFVAQAHSATLKMMARLDEVIQVSKLEHGSSQLQIQPLQLKAVLEEIQQFTTLQSQNRTLRLTITLPNPEIYVLADPHWLRQVLISLITKPIALMQEGIIRVSTQVIEAAEQVKILVEDQRPADWNENESTEAVAAVTDSELKQLATFPQSLPTFADSASPGLSLMICQTLMQLMQGNLELLSPAAIAQTTEVKTETANFTQICCSVPLASPSEN